MGIFSALFGADFAPAKCKTSLRLCLGRVKLLKNKKRVALQALRREIAELMRAGKYDSARVRVEGVLREEAMLETFEVLDLFCELLVVRLPLISSTADLPADLREAVATVVYASRRASELPELAQIRAQFAAKYGKAFVAACAEDATAAACGVSPIALEKLSAAAPADEAASSRLRAVAEEHGVAFDEEAAHRAARSPIPIGSTDTRAVRSIASAGDAPRPREYADASEAAAAARRAAAEAALLASPGKTVAAVREAAAKAAEETRAAAAAAREKATTLAEHYNSRRGARGARKGSAAGSSSGAALRSADGNRPGLAKKKSAAGAGSAGSAGSAIARRAVGGKSAGMVARDAKRVASVPVVHEERRRIWR